jgi:hypothetical protein
MNEKWFGIMKVLEVNHWRNGSLLWQKTNLYNLLHLDGEEFILRAAFVGGQVSDVIPSNYYLGLDNRSILQASDNILSLIGEPVGNGYSRQPISSSGDFTVTNEDNTHFKAISPIVAFIATGSSWGPVQNLFITNRGDTSGSLISSVNLGTGITVAAGDSVSLRIAMTLRDCA